MEILCHNRLVVLGSAETLKRFEQHSRWEQRLQAKYTELYEHSRQRICWWFDTAEPPVAAVRQLSAAWPRLVFILICDFEQSRQAGLAIAKGGKIQSCQFDY